ncbi:cation:proton antiporter [Salinarimonas rosea]|uniref:cation:proton antiporter n=1 Tax=Salinarimonas rosea TaxID=552063 RepID=UPI000419692E|nr:cation:proton antiporter family protein [Salinarimonas rosea]
MADGSIFYQIAAILALAAALGAATTALRQPLIVAFIVTGMIAGPDLLGLVSSGKIIDVLAEIAIAVLLFLVGLMLDPQAVRSLGPVALATGLGQIAFTAAVGFVLCLALGLDPVTSLYVAVALTFSSTIIIVKLLTDKREVDSLHGRIAIGFLIVQDVFVIGCFVALSAFGLALRPAAEAIAWPAALALGASAALALAVFTRYAAEPLMLRIARTPELLVVFAIGWAVALAALFDTAGLGKELGGLAAGATLASTSVREAVSTRLASLRDFLLLFFFVDLGAGLDLSSLGPEIEAALALSAFVLIGNPLIVIAIMAAMGYRRRTGFFAGLTVAQISEFSLVFVALGASLGHVPEDAVALVTLVGLVTITLSTYMITYSQQLYRIVEPALFWAERRNPFRERVDRTREEDAFDVILIGLGRYGREIADALAASGARIFGVDFDPQALRRWRAEGRAGVFGDALDPELISTLPLSGARWVAIVTRPPVAPSFWQADSRLAAIDALRRAGFEGRIAVRSHDADDAARLGRAGADLVLSPFGDSAVQASRLMGFDADAVPSGVRPSCPAPAARGTVPADRGSEGEPALPAADPRSHGGRPPA